MADDNPFWFMKEVGGALKLGSGLLGKSAIVVGILEIVVFAAVCRLHSDVAIVGGVFAGAAIFFVWFFPVITFAKEHPAEAMLEGAEWSGFQKFQTSAKNFTPRPEDMRSELPGGVAIIQSTGSILKAPEQEQNPNG